MPIYTGSDIVIGRPRHGVRLSGGGGGLDYLLDQFTGTNGDLLSAHAADTGQAWTARINDFEVASNKMRVKGVSNGDICMATTPSPFGADVTVELRFTPVNVTQAPIAIIGRYSDNDNYWRIQVSLQGGQAYIVERNAGVENTRAFRSLGLHTTWANAYYSNEHTLRVTFSGNTITSVLDNTFVMTYASASHNNTATAFGIYGRYDTAVSKDLFGDFVMWRGAGEMPVNPLHPIVLSSPDPFETIQRNGSNQGDIAIAGTFDGTHSIEARFNGGSWSTIATDAVGTFSGTLSNQAAGQGAVEVRFVDDTSKSASVPYVGIGDVFVVAGQSNAAVYSGAAWQAYSHATLRAGMFGNDYHWEELHDPVDDYILQVDTVSSDGGLSDNGTYWQLLATKIMAHTGYPVAFVPTAAGGTTISQWQPGANHQDRTTLYGSMVYRALQAQGGIKAVLWHQGESDALQNDPTDVAVYNAALDTLANAIDADLNVPTVAAKIHLWSGAPTTNQTLIDGINDAIDDAWVDNANVLPGPNFDNPAWMTNIHITTTADFAEVVARWWPALQAALYSPLPFADDFGHNDGVLGAPWKTGGTWSIVSGKAINTPGLGSELAANNGFGADTDWTKETGWTIAGGVAVKAAGVTNDIYQSILTVGKWYRVDWTISSHTAGRFNGVVGAAALTAGPPQTGSYSNTGRAGSTRAGVGATQATSAASIDNVSVKEITLADMFNAPDFAHASVDISVKITMVVPSVGSTPKAGGVVICLDSESSPANFIIAYHDGVNVRLEKCVAGTYTTLVNAAATYVAAATLRAYEVSTNTWRVIYNGSQVGSDQAISDVGIVSNTRHGLFSTHPDISFDEVPSIIAL